MLHFEWPYAKIRWNEAFQCVETEWLGFVFGEAYREVVNVVLELHHHKRSSRNLADMRLAAVIVEDDARWLLEAWIPRAMALGVRRNAVVVPASVVGQIQLDQMDKKGARKLRQELGMKHMHFQDLDEARRWLKEGA